MSNSLRALLVLVLYLGISTLGHALTSGGMESGTIASPGEKDTYTFEASAGNTIEVKIGGNISMQFNVYYPDGSRVNGSFHYVKAISLSQSGTYTVVVEASSIFATGSYYLHFVKVPGAVELGAFSNWGSRSESITSGDLDSYSFSANTGDSIHAQVAGDFPSGTDIDVYYPDGSRVISSEGRAISLSQSGTYTVVAKAHSNLYSTTGNYDLHFARAPGANEHGTLNQGVHSGSITRADLDSYSFYADVGDGFQVSAVSDIPSGVDIDVYYPSGSRVVNASSNSLSQAGTYTVVVRGGTYSAIGNYQLSYVATGSGGLSGAGPQGSDPTKEACDGSSIASSCNYVGNPINIAQGFKAQAETDYLNGRLSFTRIYRSDSSWTNQDLGHFWRHTWFRRLNFYLNASTPNVDVVDGRGAVVKFRQSGSNWLTVDPDYVAKFKYLYDASNFITGYQFSTSEDTQEYFDTTGKLTRIEYRGSEALDLTYDAASRLALVNDEQGRNLTFTYDASGRIQSMTTPDGDFSYSYDQNNNLIRVTRPDTTQRSYHYEDTTYLNALTGITNEKNVRVSTWAYDTQGRAILAQRAGGVHSYSVNYNLDNTVTMTNPLGKQTVYQFQTIKGVRKITAINQLASANSPAISKAYTYNAEGWLKSATDGEGNVTSYIRDSRGLETSRTEAVGTAVARTITTTWDPVFRMPNVITEPGRTTDYDYDAFGRVTKVTVTDVATADSRITTLTYHPNTIDSNGAVVLGRVATIDGPRTDVSDLTSYQYDVSFNLTRITNALGQQINYTAFDPSGRPLSASDQNGVVTTFVYDALGRLTSQTHNTRTTFYNYDDAGLPVLVTLPDGRTYSFGYDNAQRLTSIQSVSGERIEYVLDDAGNHLEEVTRDEANALTSRHSQEFDELGRILASIKTINSTDAVTAYSYDRNGNLKTIKDPYLASSTYQYDALQRAKSFTDAQLGITGTGFNALDQVTSVSAPNNAQTMFTYNAFGDVKQEISPDRGTTSYGYDKAGNLLSRTDARGIVVTYTYDAINRLTAINYPNSSEDVDFVYDANLDGPIACANGVGRLCKVYDESGVTHYAYDPYGNVTQRAHSELGVNYSHQFSHDDGDQLVQMVDSSGRVIDYSRDQEGRIRQVSAEVNGAHQVIASNILYRPDESETHIAFGNGLAQTRNYDESGLLLGTLLGPYVPTNVPGDVAPISSPDGVVNAADYLILQRIVLRQLTPTPEQLQNGDVYPVGAPDGVVDLQDMFQLLQMVAP